jgi:hypothetical protein
LGRGKAKAQTEDKRVEKKILPVVGNENTGIITKKQKHGGILFGKPIDTYTGKHFNDE